MTEEVKKETPKTKLPGLPPLVAFIYAVLIFIMTMGYLKVFLIMGFILAVILIIGRRYLLFLPTGICIGTMKMSKI